MKRDYISEAIPWPQKNRAAIVPLSGTEPIVSQEESNKYATNWLLTYAQQTTMLRSTVITHPQYWRSNMKYKFNAAFNIEGKAINHKMEYDSVDIVKTLERRLKTAFPNATGIQITLETEMPMSVEPKGVK